MTVEEYLDEWIRATFQVELYKLLDDPFGIGPRDPRRPFTGIRGVIE